MTLRDGGKGSDRTTQEQMHTIEPVRSMDILVIAAAVAVFKMNITIEQGRRETITSDCVHHCTQLDII